MDGEIYAAIEYHGAAKRCQVESVRTYRPQVLVILNRGSAPAVWISGDGRVLADQLEKVVEVIRSHSLWHNEL